MNRVDRSNIETFRDLGGQPKMLALDSDTPTYQMKIYDTVIVATSSEADGTGIITLPSLAEAVGKFFFISAPTGATAGDISLYEKETGAELTTYGDLDADDDHVLLFSDGLNWRVVLDGVA